MEKGNNGNTGSLLRWKLVRRALLPRNTQSQSEPEEQRISRKGRANQSFNLISIHSHQTTPTGDVCVSYALPFHTDPPTLFLYQRNHTNSATVTLSDFEICNKFRIDNTGLVCPWPSEEVLAYYCLSHSQLFSSKTIIELGAGFGLAGLALAAVSQASQVVISDGNPQVVEYIQQSIAVNSGAFGNTIVQPKLLHWDQGDITTLSHRFDFIIASDCTFFKESHKSLVRTVKLLLKDSSTSEAIFLSPRRGDSFDKFLKEITESGLHYYISENYDERVWNRHQELLKGDGSWVNYEADHCYPLLLRVMVKSQNHP